MTRQTVLKSAKKKNELIYYNVKHPAGFAGAYRMGKGSKKWLSSQPAYTLHKPLRKRFPTRKYHTDGVNHLWQMDLMEMIPYAKVNNGYRYILTCIDVFSRYARALPLKTKTGLEVVGAIDNMIKDKQPRHVQTDLGREFYNTHVSGLFRKRGINHYTVHSQFKAPHVERFNRTLRGKLNRYFTYTGRKVWKDVLPQILQTYNQHTKHRGIFNLTPAQVIGHEESALWYRQEQQVKVRSTSKTIPLLSYVRISRFSQDQTFVKNFDQNWSEEVFRVVGVDQKMHPTMYILSDLLDGDVLKGKFYWEELQVVAGPQQLFRIEKIIRSKGSGKHKQYLVKWYGYSDKHNSWVHTLQKGLATDG